LPTRVEASARAVGHLFTDGKPSARNSRTTWPWSSPQTMASTGRGQRRGRFPDYAATGNSFNGVVKGVLLSIADDKGEHLVSPEDALRVAMSAVKTFVAGSLPAAVQESLAISRIATQRTLTWPVPDTGPASRCLDPHCAEQCDQRQTARSACFGKSPQ
jgi:hypothetical protein